MATKYPKSLIPLGPAARAELLRLGREADPVELLQMDQLGLVRVICELRRALQVEEKRLEVISAQQEVRNANEHLLVMQNLLAERTCELDEMTKKPVTAPEREDEE